MKFYNTSHKIMLRVKKMVTTPSSNKNDEFIKLRNKIKNSIKNSFTKIKK